MSSVIIPFSCVERIRKLNSCIENTEDNLDRILYQAAKDYQILATGEQLDEVLDGFIKKIETFEKGRKNFWCIRVIVLLIFLSMLIVYIRIIGKLKKSSR